MSRVEHPTEPADPVFDALAQAALDYGVHEDGVSIGSIERSPVILYHLRLEGIPDRKAPFNPTISLRRQGLEMAGLLVEDGATLLIFRGG